MSKREAGLKRLNEIVGDKSDEIIANFEKISPDFANYIVEHVYADIYARKGISDKTREVVTVTAMIAQGNTGFPLKTHLKGMLNVGWTKQEIIEVIIFLSACVGFPNAVNAIKMAEEIFKEIN